MVSRGNIRLSPLCRNSFKMKTLKMQCNRVRLVRAVLYTMWRGELQGSPINEKVKFVFSGELRFYSTMLTGKREFSTRRVDGKIVKRWGRINHFRRQERTGILFSRNTNNNWGSGQQVLEKEPFPILKRRDSRQGCRKAGLFLISVSCPLMTMSSHFG